MARSRPKTRRHPKSNPRGILRVSSTGYGFVHTAEGEYFVPSSKMGGAFDGDMVELAPVSVNHHHKQVDKKHAKPGERPTARVIRVVDRSHETLIGRYEVAEPFGVVVPQDHRIPYDVFTMRSDNPDINDGDIVRVRMVEYPSRNTAATGVIEEVIGNEESETLPIDVIIARHKLETVFSEASLAQAAEAMIDDTILLGEGYRDIRDRTVFTIDPIDARDFDDALSLDVVDGLWRLGVHIADVSRYVEWNSSVDLDARRRATSVYLVDRVIPMLPEQLSNEMCSLKPHHLRAVMTADLYLDNDARVQRYELYPAIMESSARFAYEDVQESLEGESGEVVVLTKPQMKDILASGSFEDEYTTRFEVLHTLARALAAQRQASGGIDFVTTEAKVRLDDAGIPQEIMLRRKTDATEIVEEAMILANTVVATHLHERDFPSVYRVHEAPSADSMTDLIPVLQEFDHFKNVSKAEIIAGEPRALQHILALSKGRPEEELISSLLLRAMKRARYEAVCEPHYGLARESYTHFTSPIRRYPDLIVHRMLKAQLGKKSETFEAQVTNMPWLAEHSSKMERIAEAASRESQEYKIIQYLERSIGETFEGVISGVTNYGLFVRLENTAEGLVSVKSMGDEYFAFDPKRHTLTGEESGIFYRLGEKIKVVLEAADPNLGRLDLRISYTHPEH